MAYGTVSADIIQSSVTGVSLGAGNATNFKNRIINGNMTIDQRGLGSVTPTSGTVTYTVDRWNVYENQSSKFNIQQNAGSVTPPVGFKNYLGATSLSAYTVSGTDEFDIAQYIEGYNVADLGWGTANAKTVTLSAWVYSSLTGTFGGAINNSNSTRSYPFSYSIPVANTWTQISVTIPGDTSGTWNTTTGIGMLVNFSLGAGATRSGTVNTWAGSNYTQPTGSVSVVGTNGATFYITGVQLEVGSMATGFDYRDYGRELILCQRYCYVVNQYMGSSKNANTVYQGPTQLATTMRVSPTLQSGATFSVGSGSAGTPSTYSGTGAVTSVNNIYIYNVSNNWSFPVDVSVNAILSAEL
jgi:hypothetical protein